MSKANAVSEQDLREIVGLKATSHFRSMLDELDAAPWSGAPRLERPPVPALVYRAPPTLADPLRTDDGETDAPPPLEDRGDPDPGELRSAAGGHSGVNAVEACNPWSAEVDQGDGPSLHFIDDTLLSVEEERQFALLPTAPSSSGTTWWPPSFAACG